MSIGLLQFGFFTAALLPLAALLAAPPARPPASKLVYPGRDGKLVYTRDEKGNTIPDFSHCGYMGGGVRIPTVPVRRTVEPGDGDDGARIQAAIDAVSKMAPDARGFRGAVLLRKGRYQIADTLRVSAGGVVLRGEGQDESGTVLVAAGPGQRTLITVAGTGSAREVANARHTISDAYVPVGARRFRVRDAAGLNVGDMVIVHRPSTAEWIHVLGMDRIPPRRDGGRVVQWAPGSKDLRFDRVVTAIRGAEITIDAPLCNALDSAYGGGAVYRYEFPGRIGQVGIEDLRGVSEFKGATDEDHGWTFIHLDAVANAWVRRITAAHFGYAAVSVGRGAKWVTIEESSCLDPVSQITGNRRYSFSLTGQLTLVQRCFARNGRHDFVMGSTVPGPNVFLDCSAEKAHADSGPHHRWSTGTLYDNVSVRGGAINVQNRGSMGSGHGWAGANMVLWNCAADSIKCEQPPTAQNWVIGCRAGRRDGDAHWESFGRPVRPRSLYLTQLADRK